MSLDTVGRTLLDSLAGWVKSQGPKQDKRSGASGWVTGLIVSVIALLAVCFMYFRAWKQGKELAKLKHEQDVAKQEVIVAKVRKIVDEREKSAALIWTSVREKKDKATSIAVAVKMAQEQKEKTDAEIDALRNWDDVDRYLERAGGATASQPSKNHPE